MHPQAPELKAPSSCCSSPALLFSSAVILSSSRVLSAAHVPAVATQVMGNCFQSAAGMSPSRSKEETGSGGSGDGGLGGRVLEPKLRVFSLADLRAATQDFRPDGVLGEGGFGRVYKGCIHDEHSLNATRSSAGIAVAVKKLNAASNQGLREWQTEVDFLGGLEHPNLVRLLGHCCEDRNLLLVYEYMPKGSLEKHLFRRAVEPPSWQMRMNVAIGAARGLAFLHGRDIIYRDFKASNILLDADYRAKLSDFGLARSGPTTGKTHVTTRVVGTHGYAAPEYMATGHLYVKSDVYSFGVVLVELLTGLRTYDHSRPTNQVNLVPWAQPYLAGKRKIQGIVDKRLGGQFPLKAAVGVATLAEECLRRDHTDRPSMEQVVGRLEKLAT